MNHRLTVLGSVALVRDGASDPVLGMGKPLALVTYLALAPKRSATREHLVDLLWADADPVSARRNLRQALYHIRRLLGSDFVVSEGETLTLGEDLPTDYHEFLRAVEHGDLSEAVDRYGGTFFPTFAAPGGAEFEGWADLERRRLHGMYLRSLESLTREALLRHRLRDAESLARRLRDAAPERESGWRLLIETLISSGDWVRACVEADACEGMLRREERAAEAATVAALHAARQAPTHPSAEAPRLIAEMVGREREFATIASSWDAASAGRFTHVHLSGAAGIGKTRLLTDTAARIAALGGLVVSIRANQGERHLSYALTADITRALSDLPGAPGIAPATAGILLGLDPALSARFPAARSPAFSGGEALRLRTAALADLIDAVATDRPLALMIDDLHWADQESRHMVAVITARFTTQRVLLVTSTRPLPDMREWARPEDTITLRPLTVRNVEELVEGIAAIPEGLLAAGFVANLHEATQGSPLLVLQVLRLASDRELLVRDDGQWHAPDPNALAQLLSSGGTLTERLRTLTASERRLLLAIAVANGPVADAVLAGLTRQHTGGEAPPVQALERHGLLTRREDMTWESTHDLLTEALLESAKRDEIRGAHAALGEQYLQSMLEDSTDARDALRHLVQGQAGDLMHDAFAAYVRIRRREGDRRSASVLADAALADLTEPPVAKTLVRALPVHLRITRPIAIGSVAAFLAILGGVAFWWLSQPVGLRIVQTPMFMEQVSAQQPIIIEALNRIGTPAYQHGDTVVVTAVGETGHYELVGARAAALERGFARFDSLVVRWRSPSPQDLRPGGVVLRFSIPGLASVDSDTIIAGAGSAGVFLDSGLVNGQQLRPDRREVSVRVGERIAGSVYVTYRTNVGPAALLLTVIPGWGDRTWNFGAARALNSRTARDSLQVKFDFPGPERPGRYWLAFVSAAETEARFIASGTNWTLREPQWNDGDDVADLGPEEIQALITTGQLSWWALMPGIELSARGQLARPVAPEDIQSSLRAAIRGPRLLLGTAIEIVVQ